MRGLFGGKEIITPSVCETKQRHGMCMFVCWVLGVLYDRGFGCFFPFLCLIQRVIGGTVPFDFRIRRILLPVGKSMDGQHFEIPGG